MTAYPLVYSYLQFKSNDVVIVETASRMKVVSLGCSEKVMISYSFLKCVGLIKEQRAKIRGCMLGFLSRKTNLLQK